MSSPLVQLELALHNADCEVPHDQHFQGHGDKYHKLAIAAAAVFPPHSEPWWLKDRKMIQEESLNLLLQGQQAIMAKLGEIHGH